MQKLFLLSLLGISLSFSITAQAPVANFEAYLFYDACWQVTIRFKNTSQHASVFYWDVEGNNNFEAMQKPADISLYKNKVWDVTLVAEAEGKTDTITKTVEAIMNIPQFTVANADTALYAPVEVVFKNASSIRPNDSIVYQWEFGDGETSSDTNVIHRYEAPGTYYVKLTMFDKNNCNNFYFASVIIKDSAQINEYSFIKNDCITEFESSPCGYEKYYEERNDSVILSGYYWGNCGTTKTITKKQNGDTLFIKTWEVGEATTCYCGYCFEIGFPFQSVDSAIVIWDSEKLTKELISNTQINEYQPLHIFPNPVREYITLTYENYSASPVRFELLSLQGRIMLSEEFWSSTTVNLKQNGITPGLYILRLLDKKEIIYSKKIIIH